MIADSKVVRIGISPMTPQPLVNVWPKIQQECADIKFQLVPFFNTPENAREILKNLGQNIDVVGGIFDDTLLDLRQCAGTQLAMVPICCAVALHHPLAQKDHLEVSDLYGQNFMLMRRGWSHHVDELRDDLWKNHRRSALWTSIFTAWMCSTNAEMMVRCLWPSHSGSRYIRC